MAALMASRATCSLANKPVAIVGAGVAGLVCASRLAEQGFQVTVFDSGRGPGGRMSQRRERTPDGQCHYFDHGAQFFTVKDSLVQKLVDKWEADGIVAEWKSRSGSYDAGTETFTADSDYSEKRYVGVPGMNAICQALSQQQGVKAIFSVTVTRFDWKEEEKIWMLTGKDGANLGTFWAVVATDKNIASPRFSIQNELSPPLAGAGVPSLMEKIAEVTSFPSFAVMLAFPRSVTAISFDGLAISGSKFLSWASRDSSKPGRDKSKGECWVLHSTPEYAQSIIDKAGLKKPSEDLLSSVAQTLSEHFQLLGDIPAPSFTRAHRWGSAFPNICIAKEEKCLMNENRRIAVCGDFCLGPRVESAILSGLAAAEKIQGLLNLDAKI